MAKPTLLQTLLGRPSQTYAFPRENEYHVAKHDLLRSLAERKESTAAAHAIRSRGESPWPAGSGRNMTVAASSSQQSSSSFAVPTDRDLISRHLDYTASLTEAISATTDDDENEIFYTPDTSPRMSLVTSSPNVIHPSLLPLDPSFSTTSLSSTVVSSSSSMSAPTIFSSTSLPHSTSTRTTPMNSDSVCDASASSRSSPSVYASPKVEYTRPKYVPLPCPDPERSTDRWRRSPQPSSHNPKATITPMRKSDRHSLSGVYSQKPRVYNSSRQPSRKNWSKAIAKNTPSIMMSMTALLEEDEERERESDRSNAMIVESKVKVGSGSPRPNGYAPTRPRSTSPRSSAVNTKIQAGPSRQESPHDQKRPHHPRSRSKSPRRRSSMSSSSLTSTTVSTPPIPSIPSHGTPGYTSLTLPRAPPPASLSLALASSSRARTLSGGRIDLTRSGIAQTTMASVEVVKGLAGQSNGWSLGIRRGRLERRRTVSGGEVGSSTSDVRGDAPLAFTGHRGPPAYVDSGSVLVQVWAVGIDGMDEILVGGKGKEKADVGFIPGRSFVGRVLECGWDVKDIDARKGEWVMGLMDIRKCGVLAEFIVVERHRILRVPHPSMRSVADIPSRSSKSNKKATLGHRTNLNTSLTLEEFSLLPLCGVPAYRAVRTFVLGLPDEAEKCGRVLVLRGQAGIGGLAVQILVKRGWRVCVHAPMPCRVVDEKKYMKEIEDRARGWGADEVVFDDGEAGAVVRTIERLIEDGEQFDAVLDTVGGRAVWEAGERLLRSGECGLFTTLVGDVPERVIPRAVDHFKAGVRSLRVGSARKRKNSGVNRRNGTVGYAWVSVGQDVDWEGEDVRESLRAVLRIALENGVKPWTGRVVPFERAPEIFFKDDRDTLRDGGTVVVKVVG